jgi:peptide/nickel transport system ATP-binding protein
MITIDNLYISHDEKTLVDISFKIEHALAMVGESGSGKSLTLKSLLGMLPASMKSRLDIDAPFSLDAGQSVVLVPQNPFTSLSPMTKIKKHFFCEIDKAIELLKKVDLGAWVMERFTNELSGGQLQRVVLAIALSHQPKLLLLDEPTTALDSQAKGVILTLLKQLRSEMGFKMLFVSHDMASVENLCSEIVVLHKGKVVESGAMSSVLQNPQNAYTKELINANFKTRSFRK